MASSELLSQAGSILRDFSKYEEYYCSETKILDTSVYSVMDLMYNDYSPILEKLNRRLLTVSEHRSENIMATIIDDICKEEQCGVLHYKIHYPLKDVVKSCLFQSKEDKNFVMNENTHCDFLIYSIINKEIKLVVEVDGPQHNEEPQKSRDIRKDRLLNSANIQVLRIPTDSINCKEKIIDALKSKTLTQSL